MPKYMIFVIDDSTELASGNEIVAIDALNEKLRAEGHWIFAGGLSHYTHGNVIDNRDGAAIETGKSLFVESENYSGFWLIEASDVEAARTLAFEGSLACNRKVELRPLL